MYLKSNNNKMVYIETGETHKNNMVELNEGLIWKLYLEKNKKFLKVFDNTFFIFKI